MNPTFQDGLMCRVCHPPKKLRARLKVAWLIARGRDVPGTTIRVYEMYTPENPSGFSVHKKPGLGFKVGDA
jgi:hypothetical protein